MGQKPEIVETITGLRGRLAGARRAGARIGLVPTMGALHEGHLSLVRECKARCGVTVVSIFVNPAQFGPNEDFARYPRTFEADCAKLRGLADVVFAPSVAEMYPDSFATRIEVGGPALGLESDFRPHFFSGVATVVARLLLAVTPDEATFGEKDYQQLLVIRRLVSDLGLPIEILAGKTVREPDGLAMSSRNAYLSPEERKIAGQLNLVLRAAAKMAQRGEPAASAEAYGRDALLDAGFSSVDYVAIRDAETLASIETLSRPARVLAATKINGTRLIDNRAIAFLPRLRGRCRTSEASETEGGAPSGASRHLPRKRGRKKQGHNNPRAASSARSCGGRCLPPFNMRASGGASFAER